MYIEVCLSESKVFIWIEPGIELSTVTFKKNTISATHPVKMCKYSSVLKVNIVHKIAVK